MKQLFFILTIFLFLGCVKDGKNIHVQGRVWDPVLNKGKANVQISLLKNTAFGGGAPGFDSGSGGKRVVEVTTDSEGYFEILHLGGLAKYKLQLETFPDNHHLGGWSDESLAKKVKKGKTTNVDYYLLEGQKLNSKYINANCDGETDSLSLTVSYLEPYYNKSTVTSPYLGCTNIEYNSTSILPGTWYFSWKVYRPSGVTTGSMYSEIGEGNNEFILEY